MVALLFDLSYRVYPDAICEDIMVWMLNNSRTFDVKSYYEALIGLQEVSFSWKECLGAKGT